MPPYLLQPYRNRPPYLVLHAEFLCIFHKPCNILPGICDIPLYCLIKNLAVHAVDVTQTVTDNPFPVININFYSIYFTFGFTNIQSVLLNKMGFYLRMLNKKNASAQNDYLPQYAIHPVFDLYSHNKGGLFPYTKFPQERETLLLMPH